MNYAHNELIEQLAAEYVVGTLRGSARRRFQRLCSQLPAADAARRRWEDRFASLALQLDPIEPQAQTWPRILWQITAARTRRSLLRPTRGWIPYAAAAAVLVAIALWQAPQWLAPATRVVAVLGADAQHPQWRIERSADARRLRIAALAATRSNPGNAFELWALPRDGKAPVSLGLLPRQGDASLPLSVSQAAALLAAGKLAVSVEPRGGSPTGAPTGPVIMVGSVSISS
jgi:anti-sigma-K factor RskA